MPPDLGDHWGILPEYFDIFGNRCETSAETRGALLEAMGFASADPQGPQESYVRVLRPGESLRVTSPAQLAIEDGGTLRVEMTVPADLPPGYHELQPLEGGPSTLLIKTPGQCHFDPQLRLWGWAAQLYAARSSRSWGIGDLADLRRLARWSCELGAGAVLINPLSAVAPVLPQEPSPYFPSSRRFRNPLYLSIDDVPGAADAREDLSSLEIAARDLNQLRTIDRDQVFRFKMQALERLYQQKPDLPEFIDYCRTEGESLHGFAVYSVLAERFGADWRQWPVAYRHPGNHEVATFAKEHAERVLFHQWLQWLLDRQLAEAARELPLVLDLPVGVQPYGADAWQWQDCFAVNVTVGAPPDQFNAEGQDWSLAPFNPHALRAARYRPFIETIRSVFQHAGGLRIDHVMGLFRLFWIPAGKSARLGAYVRYPADELLGIVALESHRAGAWVAGEDLGTVDPEVRRRLAEHCMLSYRLLWFEDSPPGEYPEASIAAITTHDLPTVAGIWKESDLAAQQRVGLSPDREGYRAIRRRLATAAKLNEGASAAEAILKAHAALSEAPSRVIVANLDDALAVEERPNMPGTIDQWPNWRMSLPKPLEEIQSAELPRQLAAALNHASRDRSPG